MIVICKLINKKGFTLIELIVVVAILMIVGAIAVPRISGLINDAKIASDKVTVKTLNSVTTMYFTSKQTSYNDIFEGFNTDKLRMSELVNEGFLNNIPQPKSKEAEFVWLIENQLWTLFKGETTIPLSPLGSSFDEISPAIINKINELFINKGKYGKDWGEAKFTDIGLNPEDWKDPIGHIYYKPAGRLLRISPEEGYKFVVKDLNGSTKELTYRFNWDLIYNNDDQKWYYHSVVENQIIDINTFEIKH